MKTAVLCLLAVCAAAAAAQSSHPMPMNAGAASAPTAGAFSGERLGTVSFAVSCSAQSQAAFNRGVALLHNFWYSEAEPQFAEIAKADPSCAMAHWGIAMSMFHQIWDRPDDSTMKRGWEEIEKAQSPADKHDGETPDGETAREREYITALADFYRPGSEDFMARANAYSAAMGKLYQHYPDDVDAGAFYALSLLAVQAPDDATVTQQRKAMAVLTPLFAKYPDNPGVVHYVIHACDNPAMAPEGLAAANHYGEIAQSGPHAVHMAGHIYARLGMWPQDINAQIGSIAASDAAEQRHQSGLMDEPHSYDFLMYAYLQRGEDAKAKTVLERIPSVTGRIAAMPGMGSGYMSWMGAYYDGKFPIFYALEMRDWKKASGLNPVPGASPEVASVTVWARAIADGHLHNAKHARADLAKYDSLMSEVKKGKDAYLADSTGAQITRDEIAAWASFAAGQPEEAERQMRAAADLQDKVGQAEVDIPAREMLGDMLLELHQPEPALAEYRVALKLSPNRFNGLAHAGEAASEVGDRKDAEQYYAALLKSTAGADSARPELARARSFVSSMQVAAK